MENYLWQKTLLELYQNFSREVIVADNKFKRLVSASLYNHNTESTIDDLWCLMTRRNNCLTAKRLVEDAFKFLNSKGKYILCLYHKNNMSFKDIAEKKKINIRQVFRHYDKEIASFANFLTKRGFSSDVIKKQFDKDILFSNTFDKIERKANNKVQVSVKLPYSYNDDIAKNDYSSNTTEKWQFGDSDNADNL